MKKCSLMLVALLSLGGTFSVEACGGWTEKYILKLLNNPSYCSELETQENRENCYKLKQEFLAVLKSVSDAIDLAKGMNAEEFECYLNTLPSENGRSVKAIAHSSKFLSAPYETYEKLSDGLGSEDKVVANRAEDILAEIVQYQHASTSVEKGFPKHNGIMRELFLETLTAEKAPKCR